MLSAGVRFSVNIYLMVYFMVVGSSKPLFGLLVYNHRSLTACPIFSEGVFDRTDELSAVYHSFAVRT